MTAWTCLVSIYYMMFILFFHMEAEWQKHKQRAHSLNMSVACIWPRRLATVARRSANSCFCSSTTCFTVASSSRRPLTSSWKNMLITEHMKMFDHWNCANNWNCPATSRCNQAKQVLPVRSVAEEHGVLSQWQMKLQWQTGWPQQCLTCCTFRIVHC